MLKGKYKTTGYDTNGIPRVYAVDSTQFMSKFLAQGEAWKYLNAAQQDPEIFRQKLLVME